jgi:hypothetical protein
VGSRSQVLTLSPLPLYVRQGGRTLLHYCRGPGPADCRYVYVPDGCWEPVNWGGVWLP